jgi:hypothetical protein
MGANIGMERTMEPIGCERAHAWSAIRSRDRIVAACCGAVAIISLVSGSIAGAAESSKFSPLCMQLDLEVIGFIERHGQAGDISSERLGKAGLQFVAARAACLEGHSDQGAELYRDILRIEPVVASGKK